MILYNDDKWFFEGGRITLSYIFWVNYNDLEALNDA